MVETGKKEGIREADIGRAPESIYSYSTSRVIDAEEPIQEMSGTDGGSGKSVLFTSFCVWF